jgi:hypothetical protein
MARSAGPSVVDSGKAGARRPRPVKALFDDAFAPSAVESLLGHAHLRSWDPFRDLDWSRSVAWSAIELPDRSTLVGEFAEFKRMSPAERQVVKCAEMASHLSSLADGESRAAELAAATGLLTPPGAAHLWFLGTLMADEAKHHAVLVHYLQEKLHIVFRPAPALARVFGALREAQSFELNIVAGQLVLEATASALLATLLASLREPLLHRALRLIMRDEARHMSFARTLSVDRLAHPDREVLTRTQARDLVFEAAYAGAASLLASEAWEQAGVPSRIARAQAVEALRRRGFLDFYRRVVLETIHRQGYRTDRLAHLLERDLERRLREGP